MIVVAHEDPIDLKPCPICTSRRYWFDGREWICLGCFTSELEAQVWLELNNQAIQ